MQSHRYGFPDRFRSSKELFKDAQGQALHINKKVRTSGSSAKTGRVVGWEYDVENNPVVRIAFSPEDVVIMTPAEVGALTVL